LENEYNVWVLLVVSCLKASLNISYISIAVLPYLKPNLLHTRYSLKSTFLMKFKSQRIYVWVIQAMTLKWMANYSVILVYHHLAEEFCPNYSSVIMQKLTDHTIHIFVEQI
jgi:hypothetical protein